MPNRITYTALLLGLALALPAAHGQVLKTPNPGKAERSQPKADAQARKPKGSETLGVISYVPPAGWKRKATADFVTFETTDSKQGRWAMLGVYREQPGSGNAGQDFAIVWQHIMGGQFNAPMPSEIDTSQHPAGYEIKVGGTQVQTEAGGAAAILVVASGHGAVVTALFLTNHNDYIPQLDKFMQGVTLDKPRPGSMASRAIAPVAVPGAAPANQTAAAQAPAPAGGSRPAELVGTWSAGSVGGPALYDRNTGMFSTYASGSGGQLELKANGQASWARIVRMNYGCTSGFNNFRDGTWSVSGNKLTFRWTQGKLENVTCGATKPGSSPFKPSTEDWYITLYPFEGQQKMGMAETPGGENKWSYTLSGR